MQFEKGKLYRLTELDNALLIGPAEVVVPSKTAKPLIIADLATLFEYMSRYAYERAHGKLLVDAHDTALGYVGAQAERTPEKPVALL